MKSCWFSVAYAQMWCTIGYHLLQYQTHPNAGQMKPFPEMQFISSISQFKCQCSIEQAFPLPCSCSLSLQSKQPRSGGGSWLGAAEGSLRSDPAGWGRGLLPLALPDPLPPSPKTERRASKVKPPHPADRDSRYFF